MADHAAPRLLVMLSEIWTMADPRDLGALVQMAVAAERGGADGVLIGEHVVMGPAGAANGLPANPRDWLRGGNQPPDFAHPSNLELLAAIASVTSTLRLAAAAVLSPLRHPLDLGKQLATLDLLSRGRLIVMPGTSWQEEEYAALGVPFHQRGEILDEQLEIWESLWRDDSTSHHGRHYDFDDIFFFPKPWKPSGPTLWISGARMHPRALRRTIRHADGFFPGTPLSDQDLTRLAAELESAGRQLSDLELVTWLGDSTTFPDTRSVKSLDEALDAAAPRLARGITTHVMKPSQYIDEHAALEDLCRQAVAGLRDRSGTGAAA
jgi:probable F420-dependent oxidoreductase